MAGRLCRESSFGRRFAAPPNRFPGERVCQRSSPQPWRVVLGAALVGLPPSLFQGRKVVPKELSEAMVRRARGSASSHSPNLFQGERMHQKSSLKPWRIVLGASLCGLQPICFRSKRYAKGALAPKELSEGASYSRLCSVASSHSASGREGALKEIIHYTLDIFNTGSPA